MISKCIEALSNNKTRAECTPRFEVGSLHSCPYATSAFFGVCCQIMCSSDPFPPCPFYCHSVVGSVVVSIGERIKYLRGSVPPPPPLLGQFYCPRTFVFSCQKIAQGGHYFIRSVREDFFCDRLHLQCFTKSSTPLINAMDCPPLNVIGQHDDSQNNSN